MIGFFHHGNITSLFIYHTLFFLVLRPMEASCSGVSPLVFNNAVDRFANRCRGINTCPVEAG